jgi:KDEL-tailed cysteine endopeptidase
MSVNQFADMTAEEFKERFTGFRVGSYGCSKFTSIEPTPPRIDWREEGAVTDVKDQGQCGSCWAFSSTGAIEGLLAIKKGILTDLSEQELIDCATGKTYGSDGCNGGQMEGGFKYAINYGLCSFDSYPYEGVQGACKKCNSTFFPEDCRDVAPNDEVSLRVAVSRQPVAVAIEADTRYFQFYSGGILNSTDCGTNLDHGVLAVGYGEENGQNYWLVKNSWSANWGENGYVRIASGGKGSGICGIAANPSFPV